MLATSSGDFLIKFFHHRVIPTGNDGGLIEGDAQIPVPIFVFTSVAMFSARVLTARYQPAITDELFG